ncbi:MAG TPA: EamA family transporter [Mycobacteriales bacterium]|nr:EamA family transporter [Mycobacteriales bacterium]
MAGDSIIVTSRRGVDAKVWLALWVVYLVWGSTYLAIRLGVRPDHGAPFPPLIYAGIRFTIAGLLMLAFTVRRPAADRRPDPLGARQWFAASVIGVALLLGGNGLVSLAEKRIPSGIAALVVATVPIWAALLGAVGGLERISARHATGLVLGFAGVAALVAGTGSGKVQFTGVLIVLAASLSWAAGSVWSRTAPTVRRPLVMTGMEMLTGGLACLAVGFAIGEGRHLHLTQTSTSVWLALGYLIVFGSLFAYTAYVWLLHSAPLSLVTTYAFVNPLVAILLGILFVHEPFTSRTLVATALIVAGVMLIVTRSHKAAGEVTRGGRARSGEDKNAEYTGQERSVPALKDRVSKAEGLATPGPKGRADAATDGELQPEVGCR